MTPLLSIVSPVYQGEDLVNELVRRIVEEVGQITDNFEVVLVEDGSSDKSWEMIAENCLKDRRIKGIKLSRNFGQHYAVTAGLQYCSGECAVIMDCDLQDNPRDIQLLYEQFKNGYEVVFTKRIRRRHPFFKRITAKLYNSLYRILSDKNYDVDAGSLTLISRRVKEEFLKLKDKDRLYIQLLKWIGFKSTFVPVEHGERLAGKTTYSLSKLFFVALQGWTSHSHRLLQLSTFAGFLLSITTFVIGIYIVILYFLRGFQVGWPSLFVAILFSTGLILMSIGVAGIYIGKIFEQSKDRPLFIVDKKINVE